MQRVKVRVRSLAVLGVIRQRVYELKRFLCVDRSWTRLVLRVEVRFFVLVLIGPCQFLQAGLNNVLPDR